MYIPMVDGALEIQAAVTKAADFSGAWLDLGEGYQPGGLGEPVAAVVDVSALDVADADETYALKLQQTGADASGAAVDANAADIGPSVVVTATGIAVVKGLVTDRFVRLVLDVAGTTPSITYQANVGK